MSRWSQIFVLALLLSPLLDAQGQDVAGDLEGWIRDDASGEAIAYVNVSVSGPNLQGTRGSISARDGYFRVVGLPVGSYTVSLQHIGYQPAHFEHVQVQLGNATALGTIELHAAAIEMETHVVSGRRPLVDLSSSDLADNLNSKELEQLPTPRDYREVIAFVPQANTSYLGDGINVGGSTGAENQFFIEGVNVTEPMVAASGMRLPQNFVREVQIKKGGYEAEYGKATGGIINVITHSGSNERELGVFGYLTNNNFASDSRRGLGQFEQQDFDRYDVGASIGGPIVKDKLWYFAAYNPTIEAERLRIPGLDFYDDRTVSHLFASKLTWNPNPETRFDLTAFGDPSHQDRVGGDRDGLIQPQSTNENADPLLSEITSGAFTVNLSGQRTFGDRAILEASLSRLDSRDKAEAATERGRAEATYTDFIEGRLSGGYQNNTDHHVTRWAGEVSGTLFVGAHELKAGAAYENLRLDEKWIIQAPDGRAGWVVRGDTSSWTGITLLNDYEVSHRAPSLFVQDSWRISERLRLNAGLRWDALYVIDPDGDTRMSITDGVQPRVGFAYQIDRRGENKLSGSYGRFVEQIPMIAAAFYGGNYYQMNEGFDVNPLDDPSAAPIDTTIWDDSGVILDDLHAPYVNEFTLGYERLLGGLGSLGVRGIYREVGRALEDAYVPPLHELTILGNPGEGLLDYLADPVRRYRAIEFSFESAFHRRRQFAASYVLSQNYGNYTGAYDTDADNRRAHNTSAFWDPAQISDGLLPNDRTHVFKLRGSYRFEMGLSAGTFFSWQSGTPLSEYGATTFPDPGSNSHVVPRGTVGRTPSIWDWNLRLAYDLPTLGKARSRLLFDAFHLFGQRKVVDVDQKHYYALDDQGRQTGENPNYGKALAFQPPMTFRLGVETTF